MIQENELQPQDAEESESDTDIDLLMLDAQEFDEEDERKRDILKGKFCLRDKIEVSGSSTASRNQFQVAKAPGKKIILPK